MGLVEISATLSNLQKAGFVVPDISPLTSSIWPLQKHKWIPENDIRLWQTQPTRSPNYSPHARYLCLSRFIQPWDRIEPLIYQMYYFLSLSEQRIRNSLNSDNGQLHIFRIQLQDYVNFSFYYNIIWRCLNSLNILQNIRLIHYFTDIMLLTLDEQSVASVLETLLRYVHSRGREITTRHNYGVCHISKILVA